QILYEKWRQCRIHRYGQRLQVVHVSAKHGDAHQIKRSYQKHKDKPAKDASNNPRDPGNSSFCVSDTRRPNFFGLVLRNKPTFEHSIQCRCCDGSSSDAINKRDVIKGQAQHKDEKSRNPTWMDAQVLKQTYRLEKGA